MRIIVGLELDYNDVGALMRLRNYFKERNRKMYLLIRHLISLHYKAKYNNYGWVFALWFGIPPMWFYDIRNTIQWRISRLREQWRIRHGWYVCWECYCLVPPSPVYKEAGYCKDCYHWMQEQYYDYALGS
jgi:hypothetical protein